VTPLAIIFGRVLRARRIRRGLSQEAFGELAKLNRGFVGEIERGTAVASLETLEKISAALDEPLSALFRECERGM
jgi:transcriptional regulator with XRE-family HTH domain